MFIKRSQQNVTMNFTPEISAFQGAIISADNVHQFSRLSARGGNEDAIEFVIGSLSTFLEQGLYIVDGIVSRSKVSQVRKFALYIVLNADLPELQQLIESEEISTLIWTTPTIPKCLMCELMWNLHMERFISEIISYANCQLAIEVASAFLEHFKYFSPLECVDQLQLLSVACYSLICRLHMFDLKAVELQNKSTAAFNNFHQCLKYYTTPPNNHKLSSLRKDELYNYQGKSLYSLLQLIDECLTHFTSKLDTNQDRFEIYKLTYAENSIKDYPSFNVCESPNTVLLECLNNANTEILDTCKVLVMDVSVDVFCCWSEFEDNSKSMQQTIGELCYKVHNKVSALTSLAEHPVVSMLEQISRKPVEMKEKINATEDIEIIQNIDSNNEDSKVWIKALVHKEKLYQNSVLLDIVYSNMDLYDKDECYKLYSILKPYNSLEAENKDVIELLLVKAFEKCDLSKKYEILQDRFNNKILVDMQETPQFKNAMTSIFNKFIATPDADLTDVLTIFLQNPKQVLMRVFDLASENAQQTQIMLKVMKLLEKFSEHYYSTDTEACIIQIAQGMFDKTLDTEAKENNFIRFVCGLKDVSILPGIKLLLQIIMTNMHKALLKTDIGSLCLQLKLLKEAYNLQELTDYRAPMLAMIGQVLDVVRWQINTFTAKAPTALNIAIDIQTNIIDTYDGKLPDNQSQWLKSKLKNLKPLNMYYYRLLWDPPGSNYLEIVSGMTITDHTSLDILSAWLSQVICSCTQNEWYEIWDSLTVFTNSIILNIVHVAVAMVTVAEKANRTEKSAACVFYCLRNYMCVIRYKYLMESMTDEQVQSVVGKVAMITELVNDENMEELGTLLMPIFAYLTEKQTDYNISLLDCLNKYLRHTKLSPMIDKVFLNGTA